MLDMPLCRFRQTLELCLQEKREDYRFQAQLVEWQTKHLASMFSVAAREDKQVKAISKAIKAMTLLLDDEPADSTSIEDTRLLVDDEGNVRATTNDTSEEYEAANLDKQPSFEAVAALFGAETFAN